MHSTCILDSVANLLVRHMVFVGNIQKSPIASHLNGLDPFLSLSFFLSIRHNLCGGHQTRMPAYDLQSRKSCCCLGHPGKNLWF